TPTLVYCWQKILQAAAKVKPIEGSYLFDTAIINFLVEGKLANQPPGWNEAAPSICKIAFEELCKPDCNFKRETNVIAVDICLRATKFLKDALPFFIGHAPIYYELVLKLLRLYEPIIQEIGEEIFKVNALVLEVINPLKQELNLEGQMQRAEAMTKW